uniref:hypothetical protein n=1 Tax=Catenibacterium mitsuokai TaxID=100886 RepID=UPI003D781B9C
MKNIKQINIYLVDGSRYVVIPSDDNLAKYVKGNFYGGYNIGISKNEVKSIIHEWVFGGRRQLSHQVADVGITASNIISIELLEHEE